MRLLQEAEGKARDDAECVLPISTALGKGDGNALAHAAALWQIREIDRRLEKSGGGATFGLRGFDAQGKGGQGEFFILQFDARADWLPGKDMLRQFQAHGHAGERNGGKNSRHQDSGDQAGENQKQKIVAGVQRREGDEDNARHVKPALARDLVIHFVAKPAQRSAAGEHRHQGDGNPAGDQERAKSGDARETHATELGGGSRIECEQKRDRERRDGEKERANAGAIRLGPELRDGGGDAHGAAIHKGTGTDCTMSRSTASVVSDFFWSEAWRELATTRCEKTATASCLKSSGRQ